MKTKLSILFCLVFLFSGMTTYASFPVDQTDQTEMQPNQQNLNEFQIGAVQAIPMEQISQNNITQDSDMADQDGESGKSQLVALILVALVGGLGIHRFYLGYTWQGVVQLLTLGGCGVWALIDLVRIIIGDLKPNGGEYSETL